jgi:hypothetical protein
MNERNGALTTECAEVTEGVAERKIRVQRESAGHAPVDEIDDVLG